MRHGNRVKRLGRPADQRKALVRGLVTEVLRHGRIVTTKVLSGPLRCHSRQSPICVECEAQAWVGSAALV